MLASYVSFNVLLPSEMPSFVYRVAITYCAYIKHLTSGDDGLIVLQSTCSVALRLPSLSWPPSFSRLMFLDWNL